MCHSRRFTLEESGYIFIPGFFQNTVDFNPDATAVANLAASGSLDGFILVLDPYGQYVWAHALGSASGSVIITAVTRDPASGDLYLAGNFDGTVDFDPGPGTNNVTDPAVDRSMFVSRYAYNPP